MKTVLIVTVILILMSLQATGQQSKDTLDLKNGSKSEGKLPEKSKSGYRLQTSDGVINTYSSNEIEKSVSAKVPANSVKNDTLTQISKIKNHGKGQSMLLFSPTVLLNTPNGVQIAGGIKYQLFLSERFSMDADFVISKDYWHLGPGLIGLPLGLLFISQSSAIDSDSWFTFLFGVAAVVLSFEHMSYHIPVNSNSDISPYVSLLRYKSSYEHYTRSDTTFVGEQLSFAAGVQINKYFGRFVFSPYGEYNLGYKDLVSRFNVGVYLGIYFAGKVY
jgi:hypothetical protein